MIHNSTSATLASTLPASEISTRVDHLEKEIMNLAGVAELIKERLSPVLSPVLTSDNPLESGSSMSSDCVNSPYVGCKFGEKLLQLEWHVSTISAGLTKTIDRLAV